MIAQRLRTFRHDRSGVAAIEAALMLPLVILIFIGAMEYTFLVEARRTMTNASFSLVQSAAAADTIDEGRRARWAEGNRLSIDAEGLRNVRVELRSFVRRGGTVELDWSWSPNNTQAKKSNQALIPELSTQLVDGEGILVAIVEADYSPLIAGYLLDNRPMESYHSQVPIRKTIPIYR
jgi:Flp pilus assembly protein TadG